MILGKIAEDIWVNGFRYDHERVMDFPLFVRGTRPGVVDLGNRVISFSFAAGRSLSTIFAALQFMWTHAPSVPPAADLQFIAENKDYWLIDCGISKVSLVEKRGCLVIFGYDITGGYANPTRPLSGTSPS